MLPGGAVRPHRAIASAVDGKAKRYGALPLPYIIAVNAMETFAKPEDFIEALFGTDEGESRTPNGVWMGQRGPNYTRVSGVLAVERMTGWDLGQRSARLILNPWAAKPLGEIPLGVELVRVENDKLTTTSGLSVSEILDLPEGWPE